MWSPFRKLLSASPLIESKKIPHCKIKNYWKHLLKKNALFLIFFLQISSFRSFFQLVGDLSELREKDYTDLQHSPGSGRSVFHHSKEKYYKDDLFHSGIRKSSLPSQAWRVLTLSLMTWRSTSPSLFIINEWMTLFQRNNFPGCCYPWHWRLWQSGTCESVYFCKNPFSSSQLLSQF